MPGFPRHARGLAVWRTFWRGGPALSEHQTPVTDLEIARALRFFNVALEAWVVAPPLVLHAATLAGMIGDVIIGLGLIALMLSRGKRSNERYGGWAG